MADPEKLVFMVTHGPADAELATVPLSRPPRPSHPTSSWSWASRATASSS